MMGTLVVKRLKELYDLEDQQIAQNANSNELSETRKRIRLCATILKYEYFKAEATKINQSICDQQRTR